MLAPDRSEAYRDPPTWETWQVPTGQTGDPFKATPAVQKLLDAAKADHLTWKERIPKAQLALDASIKLKDRIGQGFALEVFARCYSALNQSVLSLGYYRQALPIARETENRFFETTILDSMGGESRRLNEPRSALDLFKKALAVAQKMEDQNWESYIYRDIGLAHEDLGESQEAIDPFEKSLKAARMATNRSYEAETLLDLGNLYCDMLQTRKGLDYLQQAQPIYHAIGGWGYEAETLCDIGFAYLDLGQGDQALKSQQDALTIEQSNKYPTGEASVLRDLGETYRSLGQKEKALDYHRQALAIRKTLPYKGPEAASLADIGDVYTDLGQRTSALDSFKQAVQVDRDIGDAFSEVTDLNNVGSTYAAMGDLPSALKNLDDALVIVRKHNDRDGEAMTEANIGEAYAKSNSLDMAYTHLQEALKLCQSVGNHRREAAVDKGLGDLLVRQGKASVAEEFYLSAARLDPKYAGSGRATVSHATGNSAKGSGSTEGEASARGGDQGQARGTAININAATDPSSAAGATFKSGKRYAIVVGTDTYSDKGFPKLNNAVYDATSLGKVLHDDYGFELIPLINKSKHDILQAFSAFSTKTYGPADELVVFFAGHGAYDNKLQHDGMIACSDSKADDPDFNSYLADSTLRNILDGLPIRHILLVLDVCFGGAFDKHFVEEGVPVSRGVPSAHNSDADAILRRHVTDVSRFVIMSGGIEEVSDGRPGQHSPFMWKVLDILGQDGPYVTYEDLLGPLQHLKLQPLYDVFGHSEPAARFVFVKK
ncbi:MAG: tetratricopeptide repeat protein [Fimbriimonadaceae bacterium]